MSVSKAIAPQFMDATDVFDTETLLEAVWPDEDDDIYSEFGKKIDNFGRRVYEIFIDDGAG